VTPSYVAETAKDDVWEVSIGPAANDPYLSGVVDFPLREYENAQGYKQQVVQLRVWQDVGRYDGFSGSAVTLPKADGAVAAVLTEQQLERTRPRAGGPPSSGTNVLYAVPIAAALLKFNLTTAANTRPVLPGDTSVENFLARALGSTARPVPFGGRTAQLDACDAWLRDGEAPARLLLVAPAGAGKSTLIARWLKRLTPSERPEAGGTYGLQPAPAVVFVPISLDFGTASRESFYQILSARVARAYRRNLAVAGRSYSELREEVTRLIRHRPPTGTLLLVIDGLDEALEWEPGPDFLPAELGPGVRVVASARSTAARPDARAWAEQMGWQRWKDIVLGPLEREDVLDALRDNGELRSTPGLPALATEIYRLAKGGDPLVVGLYVQDVVDHIRDSGTLPDVDALRDSPPGLDAFFDRWWASQQRQWQATRALAESDSAAVSDVFDVLALAFGPLARRDVLALIRALRTWKEAVFTGDRLNRALSTQRFVVPGPTEGSLVVAHPRLAAYRVDQLSKDGESARVEQAYLDWGREVLTRVQQRQLAVADVPVYLIRHLGDHLDRAKASPPQLLPLISREWRQAWDQATDDFEGHLPDAKRLVQAASGAVGTPTVPVEMAVAALAGITDSLQHQDLLSPALAARLLRAGLWTPGKAIGYVRGLSWRDQAATAAHVIRALPDGWDREAAGLIETLDDALLDDLTEAVSSYACWLAGRSLDRAVSYVSHKEWVTSSGPDRSQGGDQYVQAAARVALLPALAERDAARGRKVLRQVLKSHPSEDILRRLVQTVPITTATELLGSAEDPERALIASFGEANPDATGYHDWPAFVSIAAPWLPPDVRRQRLSSALARIEATPIFIAKGLETLGPVLTTELVPKALQLASRLDPLEQFDVYVALAEASAAPHDRARIEAFLRRNTAPALAQRVVVDLVLSRIAAAGLTDLVFEIALASDAPGSGIGALTQVAPYLHERWLGTALELALKESKDGRREGLRAVLARIAEIDPRDGPRQALEATYRVSPREDSQRVASLALSGAPPASWKRELTGISDDALRYTVLAARAARFPMSAKTVDRAVGTLDFFYRSPGLRIAISSMEGSQIPHPALAKRVLNHGLANHDFPLLEAYFTRLADEAGAEQAIREAQQNGYLAAAIAVQACRSILSQDAVDALEAYAIERTRRAAAPRARTSTTKADAILQAQQDRWSLAALLAALLPRNGDDPSHPLWESIAQLLDRKTTAPAWLLLNPHDRFTPAAALSPNRYAAKLLFRLLPRSYLPAANALILKGGLLAGPWWPKGGPNGGYDYSWAVGASALIDSVDPDQLPEFHRMVVRKAQGASSRNVMLSDIAGRYARLGRGAEALAVASDITIYEEVTLREMAFDLPAEDLPMWVATVCQQMSQPDMERERAAVLASASPRWKAASPAIRRNAIRSWLDQPAPTSRNDIIMEITGLSVLLIEVGADPDLLLKVITSDLSLQSLSDLRLL